MNTLSSRTLVTMGLASTLLASWAFCLPARAGALLQESPTVTLPLTQYLELRKKTEVPSVTTIEEVRLGGDLRKAGELTLRITGSSSGLMPGKAVLEPSEAFALSSCTGSAMLQVEDNALSVIPFSSHFTLDCRLTPKINSELALTVLNTLSLRNQVEGSDLITKSATPARREITLARNEPNREVKSGPVSATARYQVSIYPDDSRFQYQLSFYNPNKTLKTFELNLKNGETVQDFQTNLVYEEAPGLVRFKLPPGDSVASLGGKMAQGKFKPLLDSSQQFLLLENHPLLQITPETKARRVSVAETGMAPKFSGALAFYIRPGDDFGWGSRKLAVFESQGYTVEQARYVYFVPNQGEGIIEAGFSVNNKGTPDISLKIPGKVTYFEVDAVAQALYKDENGRLLIHLPNGQHELLVQYRPERAARGLAGSLTEQFVKPEAMISDLNVQVQVERGWHVLFGRAVSDFQSPISVRYFLFFLLTGVLYFRLFQAMGFKMASRSVAAIGMGAIYLLRPELLGWLLLVWAGSLAWNARHALQARFGALKMPTWKQGAALGLLLIACCMLFTTIQSRQVFQGLRTANELSEEGDGAMQNRPMAFAKSAQSARGGANTLNALKGAVSGGAPAPASALQMDSAVNAPPPPVGDAETFQGIPARIRIPQGGHSYFFRQGLIEKDAPIQFKLGIVNARALSLLSLLLLLAGMASVLVDRAKIAAFYRG